MNFFSVTQTQSVFSCETFVSALSILSIPLLTSACLTFQAYIAWNRNMLEVSKMEQQYDLQKAAKNMDCHRLFIGTVSRLPSDFITPKLRCQIVHISFATCPELRGWFREFYHCNS